MQKLFLLHDSKSETYASPTVHPAKGQAIRAFADAINANDGGVISSHPEDFTLFIIGEFDPRTGAITLLETKESVCNGVDLKEE